MCRDAIWWGERCNWLGWALEPLNNAWTPVYHAQSCNLYDGTAGIALFLGRLFGFTQDPLQKTTAIASLNQALSGASDIPPEIRPSVYSGTVGIGYAAIELGTILDDDRMIKRGLDMLRQTSGLTSEDVWLDVLGGSAGTLQVLMHIAGRLSLPDLRELAAAHGQRLLRTAVKSERGWSWDTLPGQSEQHLTGYGHGAGGIGCALVELWAATRDPQLLEGTREAFRYERSHFSPQHHNWPDLRAFGPTTQSQPTYALAWCHGAPGIGLSRLRALELVNDEAAERDLNEALQVTVAACSNVVFPASGSLCLCHGLGGNAELLLCTAQSRGRQELRQVAENIGRQAMAQLRPDDLPWPCGVNGAGETPNLMLGLSGIGHFYLRLHDPIRVPSLLLLSDQASRRQARQETERPELALAL